MNSKFVEHFIETKEDGHDFFNYLDHDPKQVNFDYVKMFVESSLPAKYQAMNEDSRFSAQEKAVFGSMWSRYNNDVNYREQALKYSTKYCLDDCLSLKLEDAMDEQDAWDMSN